MKIDACLRKFFMWKKYVVDGVSPFILHPSSFPPGKGMSSTDLYKTLGVARTATAEEIKKAHRKLARKFHPDLNPGDKKSEEKFKEVQQAYDVLSDEDKRGKYDQYGDMWEQAQAAGAGGAGFGGFPGGGAGGTRPGGFPPDNPNSPKPGPGLDDWFVEMFGSRVGRPKSKPAPDVFGRSAAPAEDIEFGLDLTLEEAYTGVTKTINVTVEDVCPECSGIGQKVNSKGQYDLSGSGVCPRCRGVGRVTSPRTGQVKIPAGAWDGMRSTMPGMGPADARERRGNLYVQLHILPNPKFERDGQNLLFDVNVPYTVAALGGEIQVDMLDGQQRQLVVPAGIQTGQKMRLSAQGMPALRDRKAGDAFARVKISVPRSLTDEERDLLMQLARLRNDPVRSK